MIDLASMSLLDLEETRDIIDKMIGIKSKNDLAEYEVIHELRGDECPYCHGHHVIRNGKTKKGVQKFMCMDCHKSFNPKTNSVLAYSRRGFEDHLKFIQMEIWGMTLKEEAAYLGISQTSAFCWRSKLYRSIVRYNKDNSHIRGEVKIDSTYVDLSFKGSKKGRPDIIKHRGISNDQVCINTVIDDQDDIKFKVAHLNHETIDDYRNILKGEKVDRIISDGIQGIENLAHDLNAASSIVKSEGHISADGYNLGEINELHKEIKDMITNTRGVSIRHLEGYIDMVIYRKHLRYKYEMVNKKYRAYDNAYPSYASITNTTIYHKPYPIDISVLYQS